MCLTLLQVLLVVPRLFLFGDEFLHCPRAQHGKAENEMLWKNNGDPAGRLLQQWGGGRGAPSRRSCCRQAVSDRGQSCVEDRRVSLFVFTPTSPHVSCHPPTSHPGALSGCRICSCSRDVAALQPVSQQRRFLRHQLCARGAFTAVQKREFPSLRRPKPHQTGSRFSLAQCYGTKIKTRVAPNVG